MDPIKNQSKNFGYVEFNEEASKERALNKSYHCLKGKRFRVDQYLPRSECLKIKDAKTKMGESQNQQLDFSQNLYFSNSQNKEGLTENSGNFSQMNNSHLNYFDQSNDPMLYLQLNNNHQQQNLQPNNQNSNYMYQNSYSQVVQKNSYDNYFADPYSYNLQPHNYSEEPQTQQYLIGYSDSYYNSADHYQADYENNTQTYSCNEENKFNGYYGNVPEYVTSNVQNSLGYNKFCYEENNNENVYQQAYVKNDTLEQNNIGNTTDDAYEAYYVIDPQNMNDADQAILQTDSNELENPANVYRSNMVITTELKQDNFVNDYREKKFIQQYCSL